MKTRSNANIVNECFITGEYETHKIDEDGDIDYLDELMEFTEG